jgi:protein-disulfide isomerase
VWLVSHVRVDQADNLGRICNGAANTLPVESARQDFQQVKAVKFSRRQFGRLVLATAAPAIFAGLSPGTAVADSHGAALAQKLLAAVPPHGERTIGDPKAPVTMIEYASATCPHCAEFHLKVWPGLKQDYVDAGKVLFVFREFPTDQLALGAFMLARCVPESRYFETIDLMFLQQRFWTKNPKPELFGIVREMGLSEGDAEACIKRQDLATNIKSVLKMANTEFGVKGTPTFFVNGTFLDAHDDPAKVRKGIDAELSKLGVQ